MESVFLVRKLLLQLLAFVRQKYWKVRLYCVKYHQQFGLTNEILNNLNKEIVVMHPGPINRGVEITSDVADGNHSVILDQVENGVAVRMAVIYLLASKIQN